MASILVTTPRSEMANAAREAEQVKRDGGGYYFRRFRARPNRIQIGERVFYVEDGYIRGYARVSCVRDNRDGAYCDTTGRYWPAGVYVYMFAASWCWIRPIACPGFRGWRDFADFTRDTGATVIVVGGWLDPKPEVAF